jgi:hypothetical protein
MIFANPAQFRAKSSWPAGRAILHLLKFAADCPGRRRGAGFFNRPDGRRGPDAAGGEGGGEKKRREMRNSRKAAL